MANLSARILFKKNISLLLWFLLTFRTFQRSCCQYFQAARADYRKDLRVPIRADPSFTALNSLFRQKQPRLSLRRRCSTRRGRHWWWNMSKTKSGLRQRKGHTTPPKQPSSSHTTDSEHTVNGDNVSGTGRQEEVVWGKTPGGEGL